MSAFTSARFSRCTSCRVTVSASNAVSTPNTRALEFLAKLVASRPEPVPASSAKRTPFSRPSSPSVRPYRSTYHFV